MVYARSSEINTKPRMISLHKTSPISQNANVFDCSFGKAFAISFDMRTLRIATQSIMAGCTIVLCCYAASMAINGITFELTIGAFAWMFAAFVATLLDVCVMKAEK